MGGQACVFYGAAEFSRDTDVMLLAEPRNLERLGMALDELQAECIAVPPFRLEYLERGHAIHFRCHHPDAENIRIDVMSTLRGVAPFDALWERRTTIETEGNELYELMALPDLVKAKKTQRDKDWPMIRRLIEASYEQHRDAPTPEQIRFWLLEARTPELLIELAERFPEQTSDIAQTRTLLQFAQEAVVDALRQTLTDEQEQERAHDRAYWAPLVAELEELRHARIRDRHTERGSGEADNT